MKDYKAEYRRGRNEALKEVLEPLKQFVVARSYYTHDDKSTAFF
jgi:hypothetical protein